MDAGQMNGMRNYREGNTTMCQHYENEIGLVYLMEGKTPPISKDPSVKKNCNNCANLEWVSGDVGDPEGFVCMRKEFFDKDERKMLKNMASEKYRAKGKRCFVAQDE